MSVRVGFSDATVTVTPSVGEAEPIVHEGVAVVVRVGRGRITTKRGDLIRSTDGAVETVRLEAGRWLVTFASGEQWELVKTVSRCGSCSGSR